MLYTFTFTRLVSLVRKFFNALLAALVRFEIDVLVQIVRSGNSTTFVLNILN